MSVPVEQREQMSKIVSRLIGQTVENALGWMTLYNEAEEFDEHEEATTPYAFALEDDEYGYGTVRLQRYDPQTGKPALYMNGVRFEASKDDVSILVEAIDSYIWRMQSGEVESRIDRLDEIIGQTVTPYITRISNLEELVEDQRKTLTTLTKSIARLSMALERLIEPSDDIMVSRCAAVLGCYLRDEPEARLEQMARAALERLEF